MPVSAETQARDIAIAGKALDFLETPLSGATPAYIVFDPANAASVADADRIAEAVSGNLKVKGATLEPTKVAVSDLSTLQRGGLILVAEGMSGHFQAISKTATAISAVSISADTTCVQQGHCVVGVQSTPRVEITISNAAATSAGISFKSAFLMMVKTV